MKNKILILTTVLLVLLGITNGQLLAQPSGYVLTFEDNFNGTQLDLTKWSFCPEWFRQGGSYWEADNHQFTGNGTLQLIVSESAGKVYCGAIRTKDKFKQTHGYFEVRCKLPKINGGWAAFWMMPQSGTDGPLVGSGRDGTELDVFESINGWNNKVQQALHWDGYSTLHKSESKVHNRPDLYDNNYHLMALEWTPTEYIFYIDGQVTWRTTAGGVSQVDSYLKLTLEVSNQTWPGLWSNQIVKPIYWDIDYVRAYKKSTPNGIINPVADDYVRDGAYATDNYGVANSLSLKKDVVNNNKEIYLKFDLNGINAFNSATLRLNLEMASGNANLTTWQVYYVPTDTWTETGINWNNKPASSTLLATINGTPSTGWVEWDVSTQTLAELAGDKILSLRLVSTVADNFSEVRAKSRENVDPLLRPQLAFYGSSNVAPTVSITSPVNNTVFMTPATVNITANASDADGSIAKVEFFQGTTKLGEDLTAPYSFNWVNAPAGKYSITAVATDNSGASFTSGIVSAIVNTTINPVADDYVRDGSFAADNYGLANSLSLKKDIVNNNKEIYLKFDLNGINAFNTATLRLNLAMASGNAYMTTWQVYYVPTDTWTETGINWNNKPASSTLLATINGTASTGWVEWDISSQALAELAGDKTLSLRIVSTVANNYSEVRGNSRENVDPLLRPQLKLTSSSSQTARISSIDALKDKSKEQLTKKTAVQIYPNPVKEMLYFDLVEYKGDTEARVLNIHGRMVFNQKLNESNTAIDVSKFSAGIYFVKIYNGSTEMTTKKIVKL